MSAIRERRQLAIQELVRSRELRTQSQLVDALRERGFDVTQATVSRDIAALGLRKGAGGAYVLSEDLRLQSAVLGAVTETRRAFNQLVLITGPGSANGVAAAVDAARPPGVLATIAGDDTILVIGADEASARAFQDYVDNLLEQGTGR